MNYFDYRNGCYPQYSSISSYYQDDCFGNFIDTEWIDDLFTVTVYYHFIEQEH